ncbi:LysR family transcriptional regulator [Parasedimentitalea marina]|uniref:LysR family transcriptional regulator n=2 Tax=Parasedimentitalea marina TaxID=2483033 RepID=A0A3T0MYX1_9RHOB|nr:LysR family transcriptional regulator [Parasedimentitalea marina]
MHQMDNELALRLFVTVVEENSVSKGGARLNVPQSSASRLLSRLEENLGTRLLQRSTRSLQLTEAGRIYFERARQIVTALDEASAAVRDLSGTPSGLLRVTAPAGFARQYIAPHLVEFSSLYPEINLGLSLQDTVEDLVSLGYDIAIRFGALPDSGLVARNLAGSTLVACASPAYLDQHGAPEQVADLAARNCLCFRSNPGKNSWSFTLGDQSQSVKVGGSMYSNNGDALMAAALSGYGIIMQPSWTVQIALDSGQLVRILPDHQHGPSSIPIHAVFAHKQHLPPKTRVFVEFMTRKIRANTWAIF